MDPANGRTLWTHPHKTDWGLNISTPVWSPADHLLFVSSAYGTGSRALELRQTGGKTTVTEKWFSHAHARAHRHGDPPRRLRRTASSGDFGPAFISADRLKTGKIAWQDRSFARAQLLYADGKLIVLDEDGKLGLATVSPQGLKVLSRAPGADEPRVDAADARGNDALRARPQDDRRVRSGWNVVVRRGGPVDPPAGALKCCKTSDTRSVLLPAGR